MVKLRVSPQKVEGMFKTVKHKKFHEGRRIHWVVRDEETVEARSVMWLFCWACNGDGKLEAMIDCRDIFNEIFPFSFSFFLSRVGYWFSRRFRYPDGDREKALEELLEKSCPKCKSKNLLNIDYGEILAEDEDQVMPSKKENLVFSPYNCPWLCRDCDNKWQG